MAWTSQYPITVDGVRLDTLAWGVELRKVVIPGVREANEVVPGVDGVIPAFNEDYDPATYSLDMFVRGSNEDGIIPADSVGKLRANLDHLTAIFSKRHALLDVREVVDASGATRQAMMKRQDSFTPEIEVGLSAKFTVTLVIPGVTWRGLESLDWVGEVGNFAPQEVTTLRGSSAAIRDAVLLVKGPVTNPTITDMATGFSVRLNGALAAGQTWRVNSCTWATWTANGGSLSNSDTAGLDATAATEATHPSGAFLSLTPAYDPAVGDRTVRVQLTGSGTSTATQLLIQARKAWL